MNCASNSGQTVDHFSVKVRIPQTGPDLPPSRLSPLKFTQQRTTELIKRGGARRGEVYYYAKNGSIRYETLVLQLKNLIFDGNQGVKYLPVT